MGYYPIGDDPTDMAMAGMSPDDVSGVSLYKYQNTDWDEESESGPGLKYKLYTSTKLDGKNYVIATGDSGTPFAPALALTTQ